MSSSIQIGLGFISVPKQGTTHWVKDPSFDFSHSVETTAFWARVRKRWRFFAAGVGRRKGKCAPMAVSNLSCGPQRAVHRQNRRYRPYLLSCEDLGFLRLRQDHFVDDMDHSVGGFDICCNDRGVLHHHTAFSHNRHVTALNGRGHHLV